MGNHSRWDEVRAARRAPGAETRAGVERDLVLAQLIHDLRTDAGLSQRELAERMGTTQSVVTSSSSPSRAQRRRSSRTPSRSPEIRRSRPQR